MLKMRVTYLRLFLTAAIVAGLPFALAQASSSYGDCTRLDFGKKIEISLILPLLKMSTAEKIRYIQSFGVDLFKVADPAASAIPAAPLASSSSRTKLAFLPSAPVDKFSKYIKLFSEGVLGLYMTPNNFMYTVTKPTILFIETADDWTLVHEFSHFLFDRARMIEGTTREGRLMNDSKDAQEDFFNAIAVFKLHYKYLDEEHKSQAIQSFINYARVQIIFTETSEFEEVAAEKMIRSLYIHARPQGFSEEHFQRSTRYIRSTSEKGLQSLNFLLQDCSFLTKTLGEADQELKTALKNTCDKVQRLKQENLNLLKDLNIQINPELY